MNIKIVIFILHKVKIYVREGVYAKRWKMMTDYGDGKEKNVKIKRIINKDQFNARKYFFIMFSTINS